MNYTGDIVTIEKIVEQTNMLQENIKKPIKSKASKAIAQLAMHHIYAKLKDLNNYLEEQE